ncbi:MAG: hypothetical protein M5U19_06520 [Microthrixaceae bacterium]|nr:hypothetical protein [Microthrixaceae bacterium]
MLAAGMEISDALAHLGSDPVLGPLVSSQPALRPPGCWDPFEATVRAVLAQQITVSGARTIAGRIAERLGAPVTGFARLGLNRLFPGPDRLVEADLDGVGLTRSRAAALRGVAAAALDGFDFHGPGLARRLTELAASATGPPSTSHCEWANPTRSPPPTSVCARRRVASWASNG